MESLARFLVAVTELFEAEGVALKRQLVRLIVAAGLGLIIFGLVVAGLGFLLFSLFRVLAARLTPTGATLTLGVVAMSLAWGAILYVRRLLR
ncbi:MAG: hypothetical protein ABR964_04150 [Tepidisphaeraceae bacterium]